MSSPRVPRRFSGRAAVGLSILASLGTVAPSSIGCSSTASGIELADAVMAVPATGSTAAVYLTIVNRGDEDDELLAVESPAASMVRLHRTRIDDAGRATMRPVESLRVAADSTVTLEPGGLHLMMVDPTPVNVGDTVPISFTFASAGTITTTVHVVDSVGPTISTP